MKSRPPEWGARFLLGLIRFYQRRISPRKGFRCAYAVLHGGSGCSGFVYEAIERYGASGAFSLARTRFRECKRAARVLRLQNSGGAPSSGAPPDQRRAESPGKNWDCCPDLGCLTADILLNGGLDCGSAACGAADCGALDCAAADCGACGCASCF